MKNIDIFLSMMFFTRDQSHLWHLQTTSFAEHSALGTYYDAILTFTDGFAEEYMKDGPRLKKSTVIALDDYKDVASIQKHLTKVSDYLYKLRKEVSDMPCLQNKIDEAHALIYQTQYRLTLK